MFVQPNLVLSGPSLQMLACKDELENDGPGICKLIPDLDNITGQILLQLTYKI